MFTSILKVILSGILGGIFLFLIPFLLLKALLFFLFIGLIFRLFGGRRHFGRWRRYHDYPHFQENFAGYQDKESLRDQFNQHPKQI